MTMTSNVFSNQLCQGESFQTGEASMPLEFSLCAENKTEIVSTPS